MISLIKFIVIRCILKLIRSIDNAYLSVKSQNVCLRLRKPQPESFKVMVPQTALIGKVASIIQSFLISLLILNNPYEENLL